MGIEIGPQLRPEFKRNATVHMTFCFADHEAMHAPVFDVFRVLLVVPVQIEAAHCGLPTVK